MEAKPTYPRKEKMECENCGKEIEKRSLRKYCVQCSNKLHKEKMKQVERAKQLEKNKLK